MLKVTPFVDGNQPTMVAGAAVLTVLPTCAVGLRIWARRTCNQRLRWSDFWIVANIVVLVAFWVIYIINIVVGGMGNHHDIRHPNLTESENFRCRGRQTLDLLFGFATFFLKLSTLSLVREIFRASSRAKTVQRILKYVTVVCGTVAITATTAVYFPPDYICSIDVADAEYWKFEFTTYFNYVYHLVLDVAIFAVPIWQLYPLKVKHRKKVGVMIAFGLGFG
ncbi:hypothetical protein PG988_003078 [Apiospora saccharicola]